MKQRGAKLVMSEMTPPAGLETRVAVMTAMLGTNLAMTLAILWRVFTH